MRAPHDQPLVGGSDQCTTPGGQHVIAINRDPAGIVIVRGEKLDARRGAGAIGLIQREHVVAAQVHLRVAVVVRAPSPVLRVVIVREHEGHRGPRGPHVVIVDDQLAKAIRPLAAEREGRPVDREVAEITAARSEGVVTGQSGGCFRLGKTNECGKAHRSNEKPEEGNSFHLGSSVPCLISQTPSTPQEKTITLFDLFNNCLVMESFWHPVDRQDTPKTIHRNSSRPILPPVVYDNDLPFPSPPATHHDINSTFDPTYSSPPL